MALRDLAGPAGSADTPEGHPGVGIGCEPPDFGWKSVVDEVVNRRLLEDLPQACSNGDPDILEALRRPGIFDGFGAVAPDVGHWPVDSSDDIGEADFCRGPREPKTAARTSLALHDACMLEREEYALEELHGNVLARGDHVALQPSVALHHGELCNGAKGIVGTSGNAHGSDCDTHPCCR